MTDVASQNCANFEVNYCQVPGLLIFMPIHRLVGRKQLLIQLGFSGQIDTRMIRFQSLRFYTEFYSRITKQPKKKTFFSR